MRDLKGKSLIYFPDDYVVVDLETTGLDPIYDKIIEISAIRYKNHIEVDRFSELVKEKVDSFISDLTGITNNMLKNARKIDDVLVSFNNFIQPTDILVAHNANFDVNFLYDNFQKIGINFTNSFIDTLRLARLVKTDMKKHRLKDLCTMYNLDDNGLHRGEVDCTATFNIFKGLKRDMIEKWGDTEAFMDELKRRGSTHAKDFTASDPSKISEESPLFEKVCVITGVLEKMSRKEAMQKLADIGAINGDNVTKETNFLILGNNDYCSTIVDGKSTKHKKAEKLKLKGQDIEIISENVFYEMLGIGYK